MGEILQKKNNQLYSKQCSLNFFKSKTFVTHTKVRVTHSVFTTDIALMNCFFFSRFSCFHFVFVLHSNPIKSIDYLSFELDTSTQRRYNNFEGLPTTVSCPQELKSKLTLITGRDGKL